MRPDPSRPNRATLASRRDIIVGGPLATAGERGGAAVQIEG